MRSTEPKASVTASQLQSRSKSAFFPKQNGEAYGPERISAYSQTQTMPVYSPFFTNSGADVQAVMKVHPSDDIYEKEADAMADRVMQKSRASPSEKTEDAGPAPALKSSSLYKSISRIQRQRAFESPTALELNSSNLSPGEEMPLQRITGLNFVQAKDDEAGGDAPSGVETALNSENGRGTPLPDETKSKMESGFGADFSNVKIHTGSEAVQMNEQVGARAFTRGNDIYFNKGEYKPGTDEGDHLLAHELTHTIHQGGGSEENVQRAVKKPALKDIIKASPAELQAVKQPSAGYIEKTAGTTKPKMVLKKLKAKKYLSKEDIAWLGKGLIELPTGKRHTKQAKLWKDEVRPKVAPQLKALAGASANTGKPLKLSLTKEKSKSKTGMVGQIEQLAEESLVPSWNTRGEPALFDIEHMIDWQICGSKADDIRNLILLDRKYNRQLGNIVRTNIIAHVAKVFAAYKGVFKVPADAESEMTRYALFVDGWEWSGQSLTDDQWYSHEMIKDGKNDGNPFNKKLITVCDAKIPKNHFLLITSEKRPGYILPYNMGPKEIGAFKIIKINYDKSLDKLETITVEPLVIDPKKTLGSKKKKQTFDAPFDNPETHVYKIRNAEVNRAFAANLKGMIAGVDKLSPIQFEDPVVDGFDVKITGKVISTLSFFKGVDISFGYENGMFFIHAEIPLAQLAANFPKPFKINACNLLLGANSIDGLFIAGFVAFQLGSFGEGEMYAKAKDDIELGGRFDFNSKWFSPAEINFSYKKGKWGIGGKIGVEEDKIRGVKKAVLSIDYRDDTFAAAGDAELSVPGIRSVKLMANYSEATGFRFIATTDLKKLPGIKSGTVTISVLSKPDGDIKLGAAGTAEPDFPGVPGLNTSLTVFYEDGLFDMRAKAGYKKGRFDGTIEVGVTNKAVDEKGQPQGEPKKGNEVVVFGFGSLTVDLFKGSKGTISVRLTPDKQLLVAGSFSVRNLKPFGDGVNIHKKIIEFPTIKIPLIGVPGVSIFFAIGGGAYFKFTWDPLVLKELTISFRETNINEIETAQVDIHGEVGSKAVAEAYMQIKASLGAQVLVAEIKGSLAGDAGVGVEAEAGGALDAKWNNEKGLQLKEINVYVAVNPKAIFRLKGSVSVDLDLWVTTINLYYKEWILAEGSADLKGLSLKVNFPLKFDEYGNLVRPGFDQLKIEKPDFSGDQGKAALDSGINSGAEKERKIAKEKLRNQIADDMRKSRRDDDFSPTEYAKKMKAKYNEDEDMKAFIMDSVDEEVKIQEYEEFGKLKNELRRSELTLGQKIGRAMVFKMFHSHISSGDYDAFIMELRVSEQQKTEGSGNHAMYGQPALTT